MHQWSNGKTRAPQFSEKARDPGSISLFFRGLKLRSNFLLPKENPWEKKTREERAGNSRLVHF